MLLRNTPPTILGLIPARILAPVTNTITICVYKKKDLKNERFTIHQLYNRFECSYSLWDAVLAPVVCWLGLSKLKEVIKVLKLPSKERIIVGIVIGVLIGYSVFVSFKYIEGKQIMLIPNEKVESVKVCLDNNVSCQLIFKSVDEIPAQ